MAVSPLEPKALGLYWGYQVRLIDTINKLLKECPYPDGYDLKICIDNTHGELLTQDGLASLKEEISLKNKKHILVFFSGHNYMDGLIDGDELGKVSFK